MKVSARLLNTTTIAAPLALMLAWGASARAANNAYPACPAAQSGDELQSWRDSAINAALSGDWAGPASSSVAARIELCFSQQVPACLQRAHDYSEQRLLMRPARPLQDTPEEKEMRQLPPEFVSAVPALGSNGPKRSELFTQGPSGPATYADIEKIARDRGWPVVRYKTRESGGFDTDTAALLMIRIPGDKMQPPVPYDRYVNIALPEDPGQTTKATKDVDPLPKAPIPTPADYGSGKRLPMFFTILTVRKPDAGNPAKVMFTRYRRAPGTPDFYQDPIPDAQTQCYRCHPNGLREISPLGYNVSEDDRQRGQVLPPDQWQAVKEMNRSMRANSGRGLVSWGTTADPTGKSRPVLNPNAMGPIYGATDPLTRTTTTDANGQAQVTYPTRTEGFIAGSGSKPGCAKASTRIDVPDEFGRSAGRDNKYVMTDAPPIDWQKVRDAMNCAMCHNNRTRGALNSITKFDEIEFKVLVDQSMPFGMHRNPLDQGDNPGAPVTDQLDPNERIALVNCLKAEFELEKTKTPEWLREIRCDANVNVAAPNDTAPGAGTPASITGNASADRHDAPAAGASPTVPSGPAH